MHRGKPYVLTTPGAAPASSILVSTILVLAILASSVACNRKPDDAEISRQVQSKYSQDSGLATKQLSVQASSGVVTISGFVDNDTQRVAAARQAASVDGVKEVVNNLQVGVVAPSTQTASTAPPTKPVNTVLAKTPPKVRKSKYWRNQYGEASNDTTDGAGGTNAGDTREPAPISQNPPPPAEPSMVASSAASSSVASSSIPPSAPVQPPRITIEQGTSLSVRLIDSIDTAKNQPGDTFHASLNMPLLVDGAEAIPAGTDITGHIVDLKNASKFAGQSLVVLQLDSISSNGKSYSLQTDQYRKEGSSRSKSTAEKVGGGAILGGIIGAVAGGGKGAVIGTAAGAGVGGGAQAASKSQQIKLPSETVLNFTLQAPVTVIKSADPNAARPKLDDSH
ncbi:MAG: BON domain-containing protein [Candidatus Sulfotelmatobacter sp.]